MSELTMWPQGTWVEISRVILEPDARAPQVPADTAAVPLELRVKGFLQQPTALGHEAKITTLTGRTQYGKLTSINPKHSHGFGEPVPELLSIGMELKRLLEGTIDA